MRAVGSREERAYYCQNWRGDIVTMLKATGGTSCQVYETVRYSSYGVPFAITPGDIEPDGDVDGDDNTNWPGSYQVRCDYDLDGDMDATDQNFTITNSGRTLGRGVLSHSSVANRKGYCGYEHDAVIDTLAHVRHRVLMTELGRWSRRDPLGYVDGLGAYDYSLNTPLSHSDARGLSASPVFVQRSRADTGDFTDFDFEGWPFGLGFQMGQQGRRQPYMSAFCATIVRPTLTRPLPNGQIERFCAGGPQLVTYTQNCPTGTYSYQRCLSCQGNCDSKPVCELRTMARTEGECFYIWKECFCPQEWTPTP